MEFERTATGRAIEELGKAMQDAFDRHQRMQAKVAEMLELADIGSDLRFDAISDALEKIQDIGPIQTREAVRWPETKRQTSRQIGFDI